MYDVSASGSLAHALSIQRQLSVYYYIPILYIANKSDLKPVVQLNAQGSEINPQSLEPIYVSLKNYTPNQTTDVYSQILNVAETPMKRKFLYNNRNAVSTRSTQSPLAFWTMLGGGILLFSFVTYRILFKQASFLK